MSTSRTSTFLLTLGLLIGFQSMTPQRDAVAEEQAATVERTKEVAATVEAVDLAQRLLTLKGPDGKLFTVYADERIRNLPQVEVGDQLKIRYREEVAAELKKPGEPVSAGAVSMEATRAPEGAKPGAEVERQVKTTVRIEHIDLATHTVSFIGPNGLQHTLAVQDPKMQALLGTLKVGDQVEVTYTEGLAVGVEPMN